MARLAANPSNGLQCGWCADSSIARCYDLNGRLAPTMAAACYTLVTDEPSCSAADTGTSSTPSTSRLIIIKWDV